jgi:hypothetical protein
MTFERIVEFSPAHDCIRLPCRWDKETCKPGKGGNHGVGAVDLRMVLKGPKGAVQFVLYTGWYLKETPPSPAAGPMPVDLGYHSPTQMYEDQPTMGSCPYLNGADCYSDGSGMNAKVVFDIMRSEGGEAVWRALEGYYQSTFEGDESGAQFLTDWWEQKMARLT